jgi:hypothetical protein
MKLLKEIKEDSKKRHDSPFAVDRNFSSDATVVDNFARQQAATSTGTGSARPASISDIAGKRVVGKYNIFHFMSYLMCRCRTKVKVNRLAYLLV